MVRKILALGVLIAPLFLVVSMADAQTSQDSTYEHGRAAANRGHFSAAYHIFSQLARSGHIEATFSLGRMYARGDGVQRDFRRAFELFMYAAEREHPRAQFLIGRMYWNGDGVRQDAAEAIKWYELAASQGDPQARQEIESRKGGVIGLSNRSETFDGQGDSETTTITTTAEDRLPLRPTTEQNRFAHRPTTNLTTSSPGDTITLEGEDVWAYLFIVVFIAFIVCLALAGADKIVVYYDFKDVILSILFSPFFLAAAVFGFGILSLILSPGTINIDLGELGTGEQVESISVMLVFFIICGAVLVPSFRKCTLHNRSAKVAIFVWPCKMILAPLGVVFAFAQLGRLNSKKATTGDHIGVLICFGILWWLANTLINGRRVDEGRQSQASYNSSGIETSGSFFPNLLGMMGVLASADSVVSGEEKLAVCDILETEFDFSAEAVSESLEYFREVARGDVPFVSFAKGLYRDYQESPLLLELALEILFKVASADREITNEEFKLLDQAREELHISRERFEQILAIYHQFVKGDLDHSLDRIYAVLGCKPSATDEELKSAFRKLSHSFHPDKILSKGLPPEFTKFAADKFREINEAYQEVRTVRGF